MATLITQDLEARALRALEIQEIRNRNIDRILAEARTLYRPHTEGSDNPVESYLVGENGAVTTVEGGT